MKNKILWCGLLVIVIGIASLYFFEEPEKLCKDYSDYPDGCREEDQEHCPPHKLVKCEPEYLLGCKNFAQTVDGEEGDWQRMDYNRSLDCESAYQRTCTVPPEWERIQNVYSTEYGVVVKIRTDFRPSGQADYSHQHSIFLTPEHPCFETLEEKHWENDHPDPEERNKIRKWTTGHRNDVIEFKRTCTFPPRWSSSQPSSCRCSDGEKLIFVSIAIEQDLYPTEGRLYDTVVLYERDHCFSQMNVECYC